jgi:hypothetical protein
LLRCSRRTTHLDVGADLAKHLRRSKGVENVVLDLEVLAHRDEDVERLLVRGLVADAGLEGRSGGMTFK